MNTTRSTITTAALLAFTIIAPAADRLVPTELIRDPEQESSTVFFGAFIADLIGVFWWIRQHMGPAAQLVRMNIHQFIAHMKMHPKQMPAGMTEFDLERFRALQSEQSQMGLDAWLKRFRQSRAAHPFSQFR
jgi:hypothetical protein